MNIDRGSDLNQETDRTRQAWIIGSVLILALALFLSINRQRLMLALSSGNDLTTLAVNRRVPRVTPPLTGLHFSAAPTAADFLRTGIFDQPLVPVGTPTVAENRQLAQALLAFRRARERNEGESAARRRRWHIPQ